MAEMTSMVLRSGAHEADLSGSAPPPPSGDLEAKIEDGQRQTGEGAPTPLVTSQPSTRLRLESITLEETGRAYFVDGVRSNAAGVDVRSYKEEYLKAQRAAHTPAQNRVRDELSIELNRWIQRDCSNQSLTKEVKRLSATAVPRAPTRDEEADEVPDNVNTRVQPAGRLVSALIAAEILIGLTAELYADVALWCHKYCRYCKCCAHGRHAEEAGLNANRAQVARTQLLDSAYILGSATRRDRHAKRHRWLRFLHRVNVFALLCMCCLYDFVPGRWNGTRLGVVLGPLCCFAFALVNHAMQMAHNCKIQPGHGHSRWETFKGRLTFTRLLLMVDEGEDEDRQQIREQERDVTDFLYFGATSWVTYAMGDPAGDPHTIGHVQTDDEARRAAPSRKPTIGSNSDHGNDGPTLSEADQQIWEAFNELLRARRQADELRERDSWKMLLVPSRPHTQMNLLHPKAQKEFAELIRDSKDLHFLPHSVAPSDEGSMLERPSAISHNDLLLDALVYAANAADKEKRTDGLDSRGRCKTLLSEHWLSIISAFLATIAVLIFAVFDEERWGTLDAHPLRVLYYGFGSVLLYISFNDLFFRLETHERLQRSSHHLISYLADMIPRWHICESESGQAAFIAIPRSGVPTLGIAYRWTAQSWQELHKYTVFVSSVWRICKLRGRGMGATMKLSFTIFFIVIVITVSTTLVTAYGDSSAPQVPLSIMALMSVFVLLSGSVFVLLLKAAELNSARSRIAGSGGVMMDIAAYVANPSDFPVIEREANLLLCSNKDEDYNNRAMRPLKMFGVPITTSTLATMVFTMLSALVAFGVRFVI